MRPHAPATVETKAPLQAGGAQRWADLYRGAVLDYVALTKPRIILLLLVTALGGIFLAQQGVPPGATIFYVLVGGSLGAGGANALNHYLDRDIDERMGRTRRRPIPGRRMDPRQALAFGILLNVAAFAILASFVNLLAAALTLSATVFYVLVYTAYLKRSTPQNIVVGGAAGAVPPLVGWVAVTGGLDLPAFYLFALVFFWTPPHFWALSLLIQGDYEKAGVPMMPVVMGVKETVRSIMLHSLLLVALSLLFFTIDGLGWTYFSGAAGLGLMFLYLALRLLGDPTRSHALRLYLYSLLYLTLLFGFIMVDSVLS